MNIIKYVGGPVDANCYIITFKEKAIIIDPCIKLEIVKKLIGEAHLEFIIVTHGHYDHICCLKEIVDYYQIPIYLAKNAIEKLEDPAKNCSLFLGKPTSFSFPKDRYHIVNDYEKVIVDGEDILFMHTKGHTDCSICIRIGNNFFSGDTLFKGSVGRCNLYSGNERELWISLANLKTYFTKNNDLVIYPGHEEVTTSKEELATNPYLVNA